jgi:hypothetical protein
MLHLTLVFSSADPDLISALTLKKNTVFTITISQGSVSNLNTVGEVSTLILEV